MENIPKVQKYVNNLGKEVTSLESVIENLLSEDVDSLSSIEQAEYYATVTYALDSILFGMDLFKKEKKNSRIYFISFLKSSNIIYKYIY